MGRYRYYLALQTLLPDSYRKDGDFISNLKVLREYGFDGVELNLRDPAEVDPEDLKAFLGDFGLSLSMYATGYTAKTLGLSLASTDEAKRKDSVRRTKGFLEFASRFGAGIVAGFLKGAMGEGTQANRECLKNSIAELAPEALRLKTPLLIEAVNRFESPLGHSLDDAWDLIGESKNPYMHILPDTWHMNIEETNLEAAMVRHRDHFVSFHLSENNRFFPGYGAMDFKKIAGILDALDYRGKLAIEGNLKVGFAEDVKKAMEVLGPILLK